MSVWRASFELSQEKLVFLLVAGLTFISLGRSLERIMGSNDLRKASAYLPPIGEIESPSIRIGLMLMAGWLLLTVIRTMWIRMRIRQDNQVRPHR